MQELQHGQYKVHLLDNGDIQIQHNDHTIVWVDTFYQRESQNTGYNPLVLGRPAVQVYAENNDEPALSLSVDKEVVSLLSINTELTQPIELVRGT
jgi:hypothetical protein